MHSEFTEEDRKYQTQKKEEEKHTIQTIPEKTTNAYLKYTLEFCNTILSSNIRYVFLMNVNRWMALRKSPPQK